MNIKLKKFSTSSQKMSIIIHYACISVVLHSEITCVLFPFSMNFLKYHHILRMYSMQWEKVSSPPKSICFIWHQKERLVTNLCVSGTKYSEHFPHADHSLSSLVKMKSFYCYLHNNQCYTHYRKLTIYQQKMYQLHGRGQITFV